MTHDIAHCSNDTCPAKERCRRYAVYIEDIENHYPYCSYLELADEQKQKAIELGSCPNFWSL